MRCLALTVASATLRLKMVVDSADGGAVLDRDT
jgi:hypothetical protein